MSTIRLSIQGSDELAAKFGKFASSQLKLDRSMGAIGLYLTKFFSGEVFASRGQAIGRRWPALNPKYAAWKARAFPGRPPMIRSGLLNSSFKHKSTSLTTSLWNEAEYFDAHNEGHGVPKRVMMRIDRQREKRVVKFIVYDITTQMDKAGLI